jgi:DNA-binding winged helix-turn-helix (wHTH) protein/Flp pilus assembly protein TadD
VSATGTDRTVYRFGRFRLDKGQRILEKDSGLIPLPPKAVDTLIVLLERAGEVVDKDTLFQVVWPGTFVVESSLTKNICVLRKVLDEPGCEESVIQTASKRGYRFVGAVQEEPVVTAAPAKGPEVRFRARRTQTLLFAALIVLAVLVYARKQQGTPDGTLNEADRQYRIGRHLWSKADATEVQKAVERLQKATELDPKSALAHAGLADAYILKTMLGSGGPADLSRAREKASLAVRLDPKLALPHVSLGWALALADLNLKEAEREYRRALTLDPESVPAHYTYACLLVFSGRTEEARKLIRRAQQLDPVSPLVGVMAGRIEYFDRRYQHAIELLREVLEREPAFSQAHYYLAMSLGQLGRTKEAREHLHQARPHASLLATDEAWLRAIEGDRAPARALVAERRSLVASGRANAVVLLMPAIDAGEHEIAIEALEAMWTTRRIELLTLSATPRVDALRSDARFTAILRRLWPDS